MNPETPNDIESFYKAYKIIIDKDMKTLLRTQGEAIAAVKANQYVIGSVSANGDFSVAGSPTAHASMTDVRAECKRLASVQPGKMFVIFLMVGAELVPSRPTISI